MNTYQQQDQTKPKKSLTNDKYDCDWNGDFGPKDSFLELSIGSRIEESGSEQSF